MKEAHLKKGDIVWNSYHSNLRFGKVVECATKGETLKWGYFKVKWYGDEVYENQMSFRKKLSGEDRTLEEYRADQIHIVSLDRLKKIVEEIERGS